MYPIVILLCSVLAMIAAEGGIHEDPLIFNAVYNWWNVFQKSLAWRHATLARDKKRFVRLAAVRHLAKSKHLTGTYHRDG